MLTASSSDETKIESAPSCPVLAALLMTAITSSTTPSETTISTLVLGVKSTVYSCPRYVSVWRPYRSDSRTSLTVRVITPISASASLTSWSLKGCTIASTFFIEDGPPLLSWLVVRSREDRDGHTAVHP